MKERKLQITGQSQPQMLTLDAELRLMANNWRRVGVKITINNKFIPEQQLREAPSPKHQATSHKLQAPSFRNLVLIWP